MAKTSGKSRAARSGPACAAVPLRSAPGSARRLGALGPGRVVGEDDAACPGVGGGGPFAAVPIMSRARPDGVSAPFRPGQSRRPRGGMLPHAGGSSWQGRRSVPRSPRMPDVVSASGPGRRSVPMMPQLRAWRQRIVIAETAERFRPGPACPDRSGEWCPESGPLAPCPMLSCPPARRRRRSRDLARPADLSRGRGGGRARPSGGRNRPPHGRRSG